MRNFLIAGLGVFLLTAGLHAEPGVKGKITAVMHGLFPDMKVTHIRESQLPGVYEVMLGTQVYYVSADGRYLMKGDLYDLQKKRNLSERVRAAARTEVLKKIPPSDYIEFAPKHPKHTIYVFTDVTCPFCRRLHSHIAQLNNGGLAVRYLAFPRNGLKSPAYREMVSVWCAKDRKAALTAAKRGEHIPARQCPNPVKKDFNLGQNMGVRGTPAIYLENGKQIGGYKPPDQLLKIVAQN
ncbi:MAG: DsbC family protein [Gammaproteobacteria bacterium]|jgi:thiol:disulfide interchange protein DsbC